VPQQRRQRKPREVPEWEAYASYEHIVTRWKELQTRAKEFESRAHRAEQVERFWQIAAGLGWTATLILVLVVLAQ